MYLVVSYKIHTLMNLISFSLLQPMVENVIVLLIHWPRWSFQLSTVYTNAIKTLLFYFYVLNRYEVPIPQFNLNYFSKSA